MNFNLLINQSKDKLNLWCILSTTTNKPFNCCHSNLASVFQLLTYTTNHYPFYLTLTPFAKHPFDTKIASLTVTQSSPLFMIGGPNYINRIRRDGL